MSVEKWKKKQKRSIVSNNRAAVSLMQTAGILTRAEVAEAEANSMRSRPNLTRPRLRPKLHKFFSAKVYILTPFSPKNCNFQWIFDGMRGLQKFRLKTSFNMGTLLVNTAKMTSYTIGCRLLLLCLHVE